MENRRILFRERLNHRRHASLNRSQMFRCLAVLYYYIAISSTTKLLAFHSLSPFVQAQLTMSSVDLCQLNIWIYDDLQHCEALQPPSGVGSIIADNTCRTTSIDTSLTQSQSDYKLFPGNYRAQCTTDGNSIHFLESGCIDSSCSTETTGADMCQRDLNSYSSLYSRLSISEYEVQRISNATSTSWAGCSRISDGRKSVSFIIFGDCNSTACSRLALSSPTPPSVMTPSTALPTTESTVMVLPTPTVSPSDIVTSSNDSFYARSIEPLNVVSTTEVFGTPDNSNHRVEKISIGMVLSEIDGLLTATNMNLLESVTRNQLYNTARTSGYAVLNIVVQLVEQVLLGESITTIPPKFRRTRKMVGAVGTTIQERQSRLRALTYNWDNSFWVLFDVTMTFSVETPKTVTAERIIKDSFKSEAERIRFILQLVTTENERTNSIVFSNVTGIEILDMTGVSLSQSSSIPFDNKTNSPSSSPMLTTFNSSEPSLRQAKDDDGGRMNAIIVSSVLVGGIFLLVVGGYFVYKCGKHNALIEHATTRTVGTVTSAESLVTETLYRRSTTVTRDPSVGNITSSTGRATASSSHCRESNMKPTVESLNT